MSISLKMAVGTTLLLAAVFAVAHLLYRTEAHERMAHEIELDSELTAKLVLRSFEKVVPGDRPVHAPSLARNLVELPNIHNIVVVAATDIIAYSHHPEDVGKRLEPTRDAPCASCHRADRPPLRSRRFVSRQGEPVYHRGFAIENLPSCQRCHDPRFERLGMLLMTHELSRYEADLERWETSTVLSVLAAIIAATLAILLLFRRLVRQPLGRLGEQIARVEAGHFDGIRAPAGTDEVASLHRSFAAMATKLADAHRQLEERVQEGTERISDLSQELNVLYSNLMHLEHLSAMGTLSAQMAHEIRTPLNALGLNVQLVERVLRKAAVPDERLVALTGNVGREVGRIVEILDRFMGRVRRPAVEGPREAIAPVVESVAFLMNTEARRAGVSLTVDVDADAGDLEVNGNHVRQILTNLVSNAIKATPEQGRVSIRASITEAGQPSLVVDDSGPGIPEELEARIFEPFFTTRSDGTGLGLAITERLVTECGGAVSVGRSSSGGASFRVVLGAGPQPEKAERESS